MSGELDFKMVANNDHAVDCYIRRSNSKLPLNLTGCRVVWQLFENGVPVVTKDSDIGDEEIMIFEQNLEENVGRLRLFLVPDDTKDLLTDEYKKHEFVVIDSNGKVLNVSEDDELLTVGQMWLRRQFTVQPVTP